MTSGPSFYGNQTPTLIYDDYYTYDYSGDDSLVFLEDNESLRFAGTFSGILYAVIFLLSLVGNGFLLWVLLMREDLKKTTTLFLLQLTISDLLLTLSLPFWAVYHLLEWVFGTVACHLLAGVFFLGFYSYISFLAAVTVDRYLVVVHAVRFLRSQSVLCVWLASASLWLVCIAASVPEAVYSETRVQDGVMLCGTAPVPLHMELMGYGLQICVFFTLPLAIILYCYARIGLTVLRCRSVRRHQALRVIFCMVAGFFTCWAPYNVVLFLFILQHLGCPALKGPGATERLEYAYQVCHTLAFCHCVLNPALHVFGSERFRSYLSAGRHGDRGRSLTFSSQNGGRGGSTSHQTQTFV